MIRSELIKKLESENPELKTEEIEKIVDLFFNQIIQRLADGGRVELAHRLKYPQSAFHISNPARKCASSLTNKRTHQSGLTAVHLCCLRHSRADVAEW